MYDKLIIEKNNLINNIENLELLINDLNFNKNNKNILEIQLIIQNIICDYDNLIMNINNKITNNNELILINNILDLNNLKNKINYLNELNILLEEELNILIK